MTRAFVAGVGETDYSWSSGRTEQALAVEAIRAAVADAGLEPGDVDGIARFSLEPTTPDHLVERMGLRPLRFAADDSNGGMAACGLLGLAQGAIATGRAHAVVVYRSLNGRSGRRFGQPPPGSVARSLTASGASPLGGEFAGPYGLVYPAQAFALWTRAYMDAHEISDDEMAAALGAVAITAREHAGRNPRAMLHDRPLDAAAYAASPLLSDPIRVADMCLETDGACALVVTGEAARGRAPVEVLGVTQSIGRGYDRLFLAGGELPPQPPPGWLPGWMAELGARPADLDVLCTYDASTANVVFDVEAVGLCDRGEGHQWVRKPTIPCNPSGGHLAEAYLQGVNQAVAAVRQVRAGARLALVTSAGCGSAALLGAA